MPTPTSYQPFLDDYVVYWVAGRQVLEGRAEQLYDLRTIKSAEAQAVGKPEDEILTLPFYNPPFIAGLMTPLAVLPLKASALVFTALMFVVLGLALRPLLARLDNTIEVTLWVAGILSSLPVFYAVGHGQFSFLLLLVFTTSYILFKRGSDDLGGATLALLLMKPQLAVIPLLVLVFKRRGAALRGFAIGATALGIISLVIAGPNFIIEYPSLLMNAASWDDESGILTWAMYGWNAFFRGLIGPSDYGLVVILHLVASLGTVGIVLVVWREKWEANSPDFDVRFSILVLAVLLTSPHLYGQDVVIAILPAILLYTATRNPLMKAALACCFLGAWLLMYFHFSILLTTSINFVTLALFATMILAAASLKRKSLQPAQDSASVFISVGRSLPDVS